VELVIEYTYGVRFQLNFICDHQPFHDLVNEDQANSRLESDRYRITKNEDIKLEFPDGTFTGPLGNFDLEASRYMLGCGCRWGPMDPVSGVMAAGTNQAAL
jgi:hypothetical protein